MSKARLAVGALSLSAVAFVGLITHEGYTDRAVIPTKGDVPTVGFGSTVREDGSRVTMADTTNPVAAAKRSLAHLERTQADLRACLNVPLTQGEWDVYVDFAYQYGAPTFCRSTIAKRLQTGDYRGACDALLLYRFAAGFDCSTPGNRRCAGVWTRQQERHAQCVAAQ